MKTRNRKFKDKSDKSSKGRTKKILIMSVLFGALLIGGSITAFSNYGKNNSKNNANIQQIITHLTSPTLPGANALGSNNATISIIEFGDYQCPFCARFNNEIKDALVSQYVDTGIAKFIFKDFVINDLPKDRLSTLAAEASYCAAEQGKYWQYHDEVYRNSKGENTGWVTKQSLLNFANNVKIPDIPKFNTCLSTHKYNKEVVQNDIFAREIGLTSTPTFLILKQNSTKIAAVEGAQPIKVFRNVIEQFLNNTI